MRFEAPFPRPVSGKSLGHFEILETIGVGGMGVVYRARDIRLGRLVALKVLGRQLFRDESARRRFLREAQLAASIVHPNVAAIHEIDEEDGALFIAMELVPGTNLKDLLRSGPLPLDKVISIGSQVCEALDAAHRLGIIHRDIKASNVLVTPSGQAKVVDFGLAKALGDTPSEGYSSEEITRQGVAIGTLSYMSPEQASGRDLDPRSDLFSLGVVLYEAASGQLPFQGKSDRELLQAIRSEVPQPLHQLRRQIPLAFSNVVSRCLAKQPEDRYPSATSLQQDLARLAQEAPPRLRTVTERARAVTESIRTALAARWRAKWYAVLAASLVAAGLVAYWAKSTDADLFGESDLRWVMVAAFQNRTGDQDFERTIEDVLSAELDQSPQFKVVPRERLEELLAEMGIPEKSAGLDIRLAREACLRGEVPVLVSGSIARLGSDFVIITQVWDVARNESLATYKEAAPGKAQVLPALDRLAAAIRRRAGETRPSLQALDGPAELWTSSSWEALQLYSEALERYRSEETVTAISLLRRAIDLDPNFAIAYAWLGRIYMTMRDRPRSDQAFLKALERVDRLTVKERGIIRSRYHLFTEEYGRALEELEQLVSLYPIDPEIHQAQAYAYWMLGEYAAAAERYQRAMDLSPPLRDLHYNRANLFLFMADYQRASEEIDRAARLDPGSLSLEYSRGYLELLRGNEEQALEHFQRMASSTDSFRKNRGLFHVAITHSLLGQYRRAQATLEERIILSRNRAQSNPEAESLLLLARLALDRRKPKEVRDHVRRALDLTLDEFGLELAGELMARAASNSAAERILGRLQSLSRRAPMVERLTQQLRGEIELARGNRDQAVRLLEGSVALTSAPGWSEPLARALLAAGHLDRAEIEYEKILESKGELFMRPGYIWGPPLYSEALLRLAQIYDRQGKREQAGRFYRSYLDLRSAADSDLADVRIARVSLARIERAR